MQFRERDRAREGERAENVKIKMKEKRIQRVLMAIPCAVYKVFRNTEQKITSYAGAGVTRVPAHSYTKLRKKEFNETSAFTTLIKSRKKRP